MEFIERHDLKKIHYLNSLPFSKLKPYLGKAKNDEDRQSKFDNIKRFCNAVIKGRGQMIRPYAYSLATPLETGGRLYCGLSVQGLPKSVRGFLMTHTLDIDMKNCHPTILYYLCRKHCIPCPNLEYYIHHRDEILDQFENREMGKEIFNAAVNNDKKNYKEKNAFFRAFDSEIKTIQHALTPLDIYQNIRESVPDANKIKNWNGSTINRILCMYENRILQTAMNVCLSQGIEIAVPMFDGMMVYLPLPTSTEQLLLDITERVESDFSGLHMAWDTKPHKEDIEMPDDFEIENKIVAPHQKVAQNDLEAGQMIYGELKPILIYSKSILYFKKDNLWIQDADEIRSSIRSYVMNAHICRMHKNELYDYSQNVKNALAITTCVIDEAIVHKNDEWVQQLFHSSFGYVLFNNGYWDCKQGVFHPTHSPLFDSSILFTEKIPIDYDSTDSSEYKERIRHLLFSEPFGETVGHYYLLQLARALAGDHMKRFLVGIGPSNTGKSILTSALGAACGGYFEGWSAGNLVYKQSSQDEGQQHRWLYLLRTKRIVISNEMKSTVPIDANIIKKMSNGGHDPIIGRIHHGNETSFKFGGLALLFAQDLPKIIPIDDAVSSRVRAIPYSKVYVDEPSNEYELKKDVRLDEEIQTPAFRMAFLQLMFQTYLEFHQGGRMDIELDEIKQAVLDVVGTETNVMDAFLNQYEITNNPEDFIPSSSIQQWLTDTKKGVTITKLGMELQRYVKIHKFENVSSSNKKVNKKVMKCWFGVREIEDE